MSKERWLQDALHNLRKFAKKEGLAAADDALRIAIIRVSLEQGTATRLSAGDLAHGIEPQVPLVDNMIK